MICFRFFRDWTGYFGLNGYEGLFDCFSIAYKKLLGKSDFLCFWLKYELFLKYGLKFLGFIGVTLLQSISTSILQLSSELNILNDSLQTILLLIYF